MRHALLVVIFGSVALAAAKGGYGLISGSLGMQADGLHSLLHALGSVVGVVGVSLAARPPDPSHPYGYERYEPLASLGIVAFMFLAIREILVEAWERLVDGQPPDVTVYSFLVMGGAVLATLGLAIWEQRRGQALSSSVLVADAKRAFSDVLVSLTVIVGLIAALAGAPVVDLLVAVAVSAVIAWTGWTLLREVSAVLTDAAVGNLDQIGRAALSVPGVQGVHRVRARGAAGSVRVDLHITVDPSMSVSAAHELTHRVRERVRREVAGITEVLIHVGVEPERAHLPE